MEGLGGPGRRPCVLAADNDDGVRNLLVAIFDHFGARALVARDGRQAIELFQQHQDEIDLVLLDVETPGSGARAALDAIRRADPAVPCWLVTGDPYGLSPDDLLEHGVEGVLLKPFNLEVLREVITSFAPV